MARHSHDSASPAAPHVLDVVSNMDEHECAGDATRIGLFLLQLDEEQGIPYSDWDDYKAMAHRLMDVKGITAEQVVGVMKVLSGE